MDTFATIWETELKAEHQVDITKGLDKLKAALAALESAKIKTVMFSIGWNDMQPAENSTRIDYLDQLVGTVCSTTKLRVMMVVDLLRPPGWVRDRFPDSSPSDASGRLYTGHISWFHELGIKRGLAFLDVVARHLAGTYSGCAVAIQPVYNNEYEAKYTQEYDLFQDYSPYAVAAFQTWLRSGIPTVAALNSRWGSAFGSWKDVRPPVLHAGARMGFDESASYWDWMRFREEWGADTFNRACAVVKAAGLQCYHHFPEFFSVLDAIYAAGMFPRIAASEHTDFVIMDSNFRTSYRTAVKHTLKLRLYVGAAQAYGKPVYFEAAMERFNDRAFIVEGYKDALIAGAANMGITNWINRVEMNASLTEAILPHPPCPATERVGVFLPLQSCIGWWGLQREAEAQDPLHDFVEAIAENVTARGCGAEAAVYVELERFLADMDTFDSAVFVEPLLLWGGAEAEAYWGAKAALQRVPHQVLRLPTNHSRGLDLKVLSNPWEGLPRPPLLR
ncbi:hypothetical protein HYH03_013550 [Edaphochlamys debaryana]|uniref:Glycoside hydrolase family 42 N-terminal domain-containing protein n=1 Tax=Edaphochlamys debaryana TaxID=47281 RepID=A0A835XPI1_9CHLO|nr:hypothetical protein HYH03_013550 [Edaphochlamys debaryana]|eukprot:KAG2487833.1 hypothetical protein HYH03_013550 [Edaphochlamys debaryana]